MVAPSPLTMLPEVPVMSGFSTRMLPLVAGLSLASALALLPVSAARAADANPMPSLVYVRGGDVYVYSLQHKTERRVTTGGRYNRIAAAPPGTRLLVVRSQGDAGDLLDLQTGQVLWTGPVSGWVLPVTGKGLLLPATNGQPPSLTFLDPATASVKILPLKRPMQDIGLAPSPDGRQVAAIGTTGEGLDDKQGVCTVSTADGSVVYRREEDTGVNYFEWSPDSGLLAYAPHISGGNQGLRILNVREGGYRELTNGDTDVIGWAPDTSAVYCYDFYSHSAFREAQFWYGPVATYGFRRKDWQRFPLDLTRPVRGLADMAALNGPDGYEIGYLCLPTGAARAKLGKVGATIDQLDTLADKAEGGDKILRDRLVAELDPLPRELWAFNPRTGARRMITSGRYSSMQPSPDGRFLALARVPEGNGVTVVDAQTGQTAADLPALRLFYVHWLPGAPAVPAGAP